MLSLADPVISRCGVAVGVKAFAENMSYYVMTSLHLVQLKKAVVPKPPLQSLI